MPALAQPLGSTIFFNDNTATPLGRVTVAGTHNPGPGVPQWRTLQVHALVLVLGGSALLEAEGAHPIRVKAGDLFWLFRGIRHRYLPETTASWKEFWLLFEGPGFAAWEGHLLDAAHPVLPLGNPSFWLSRLQWSLFDTSEQTPLHAVTRVARLNVVMSEMWQHLHRSKFSAMDRNWMNSAKSALKRSIGNDGTLQQVARSLGCGYDVFRRRFRKLAGISPAQYRHRLKLDTCAELLLYGEYTNKELADRFHFSSEFHFSREFTRHVGLSPRAFFKAGRVEEIKRTLIS